MVHHERIHTGEKPYKCEHCDKGFPIKAYLIKHRRTHTGERPFKCNLCDRSFTVKPYLIKHKRTHSSENPRSRNVIPGLALTDENDPMTGENSFNCQLCNESFSASSDLAKHARSHPKKKSFKCKHCRKAFLFKRSLNNHCALRHESLYENIFPCELCHKKFLSESYLNRHMIQMHETKDIILKDADKVGKIKQEAVISDSSSLKEDTIRIKHESGISNAFDHEKEKIRIIKQEMKTTEEVCDENEKITIKQERKINNIILGHEIEKSKTIGILTDTRRGTYKQEGVHTDTFDCEVEKVRNIKQETELADKLGCKQKMTRTIKQEAKITDVSSFKKKKVRTFNQESRIADTFGYENEKVENVNNESTNALRNEKERTRNLLQKAMIKDEKSTEETEFSNACIKEEVSESSEKEGEMFNDCHFSANNCFIKSEPIEKEIKTFDKAELSSDLVENESDDEIIDQLNVDGTFHQGNNSSTTNHHEKNLIFVKQETSEEILNGEAFVDVSPRY